jgi:peroxiredoxin
MAVFLVLSLLVNVLLARAITSARRELIRTQQLVPGDEVPELDVVDSEGRQTRFSFKGERPTVFYYFSPNCSWCKKNARNLDSMVRAVGRSHRVISFTVDTIGLQAYIQAAGHTLPVYTDISDTVRTHLKLGGTPQTIVVSKEGRVVKNWRGAFVGALKKDVESYFSIALPGAEVGEVSSSH